jgi:hypothetical protein
MKLAKRLIGTAAVVGLVSGVLAGPAAAHRRVITQVYAETWVDGGTEHHIDTQVWLSPEQHPGTVRTTLRMKNDAGDWVFVDRKRANFQLGWGYYARFDPIVGDESCKAFAKVTANNHPTLRKSSPAFAC